jgi:uncharacterized protein with LGFP repeats
VTDTSCGLADGGCYQVFQGGSVYVSAGSPAHVVLGAIRVRWGATGWETGPLGYPVSDERCGLRGGGCLQEFQRGSIAWSAAGAWPVPAGPIATAWTDLGREAGSLGYPTGEPYAVPGGQAQRFQGGVLTFLAATNEVRRS